ncbi:hypothetical protein IQ255_24460 [Pleurocapsales cyanobacterium LEGE 10410]|nr:hypothetical protein [Pleurocapsales cyanobacterium LEGE 10410]
MNLQKVTLSLILSLSFLFGACQGESTQTPDNSEDAGEAIEDAGEDAEEAIEDAGDSIEDATD